MIAELDVCDPDVVELETLIEDHQAGVWRYLRAIGCAAHEADDLTQETFLAVMRKPFIYRGPAAAAGYLRKVAYHKFLSSRRKKNLEVSVEHLERDDKTWTRWNDDDGAELLEALAECFALLPERSRKALEMRFRDRLPRSEIAAALRISEDGAKNLMQRAKKKLRDGVARKVRDSAGNLTRLARTG